MALLYMSNLHCRNKLRISKSRREKNEKHASPYRWCVPVAQPKCKLFVWDNALAKFSVTDPPWNLLLLDRDASGNSAEQWTRARVNLFSASEPVAWRLCVCFQFIRGPIRDDTWSRVCWAALNKDHILLRYTWKALIERNFTKSINSKSDLGLISWLPR